MNLFKKTTATIALVALVSGIFSTGVAAYSETEVEAANALAAAGYINDHSGDSAAYNLDQNVLRQEIAAVARGIAGLDKKTSCDNTFADVSATTPNTWACASIEALSDADLVSTSNANFNPESNISKAEAIGMMVKAAFGAEYAYDSTNSDSWMKQVVDFAASKGIVSNFTNYDTAATRGFVFEAGNEAVIASDEVVEDTCDDISALLGLCDEVAEDTTTDDTTTDDTTETPVVVSGDNVLTVELSPETPVDGYVVVNVARTAMLKFDVTAGSEDVSLDKVNLLFTGFGDRKKVDDVTVYNSTNESVSKTRSFVDNDLELSFDNNVVVKAGETETFTVAATINTTATNTTYQITLDTLEASSTVEGENIVGASLSPIDFANAAELKITDDKASKDVTVGENVKLAGFDIEERNDNEDVIIKTITLHLAGTVDSDYVEELTLSVEGEVVASNLTINSDDEVVANIDYTLAADDKVTFELEGTITGDVGEKVEFKFTSSDDIYAVGATTGYNVGFDATFTTDAQALAIDIAAEKTIDGSEINVSFTKSDIDETKTDKDDVLLGTLKVNALTDDYEITTIEVVVDGTTSTGVALTDTQLTATVKNLNLGGNVYDIVTVGTNKLTYTFSDIVLSANEDLELALEMDVESDTVLNGNELTFDLSITEVEDVTNDVTYTTTLGDVLSTTSFDDKQITIQSATFELSQVAINDRTLVLGNVDDVIVYKAKINIGDSDSVVVDDLTLKVVGTIAAGVNLDDVVDSAELRIGSTVYAADLNTDSLDFSNIDHEITAGSDNVELLVTVNLKDDDTLTGATNNFELEINATGDITVEDSVGDSLEAANLTIATGSTTATTLRENGTFTVEFNTDEDTTNLTGVNNFALAGSNNVVLAKVDFDADYEDAVVKELAFTVAGGVDYTNTLTNVRLVSEGVVIADGASVDYTGGSTIINFDQTFNIELEGEVETLIVADINPITDEGGYTSSVGGAIALTLTGAFDVEGAVSLDNYDYVAPTVAPKTVTIAANTVAAVTLDSTTSLASAGVDSALATLVVDTANQDFNRTNDGSDIIEAILDTVDLTFAGAATVTDIKLSRAGVTLTGTVAAGTVAFDTATLSAQDLIDFATIDNGHAEFDILVSYTSASTDDDLTIQLVADTDVTLDDGVNTSITKVYSSKTSVSTKTQEVLIQR